MNVVFVYGALEIARSGDVPGALIFSLSEDDGQVFRQIVSPEACQKLAALVSHMGSGEITEGSLRIVKHQAGWLEVMLAAWCDPEPMECIPEKHYRHVLRAVRPGPPN
jgi:hypothetical protein